MSSSWERAFPKRYQRNYPGTTAISATLVQVHDACDLPTTGHPAWIVNLRPPVGARTMSESPQAIQYMLVGVDPATGVPWGLGTFGNGNGGKKVPSSGSNLKC